MVVDPQPAAWQQLAACIRRSTWGSCRPATSTIAELAQLEVPWSPDIVEGFRAMTGGTIAAARHALWLRGPVTCVSYRRRLSSRVCQPWRRLLPVQRCRGGIRLLIDEGRIERAAVIDLDVHHGNGTAFIFENEPSVFTFSMHQQHNYPALKPRGSLDVGLADGTRDEAYLARFEAALPESSPMHRKSPSTSQAPIRTRTTSSAGSRLTKHGLRVRDRW